MKAQELRIGNHVDIIDRSNEVHLPMNTVKKIGKIDLFHVDLYDINFPFSQQIPKPRVSIYDLSPIPLTEEWLEKMGFDEWTEGHWKTRSSLNINGWSEKYNYYLPYFMLSTYTGSVEIKHVHQLQNLYFALTGEELKYERTIKP